jgi:hypothetical protein
MSYLLPVFAHVSRRVFPVGEILPRGTLTSTDDSIRRSCSLSYSAVVSSPEVDFDVKPWPTPLPSDLGSGVPAIIHPSYGESENFWRKLVTDVRLVRCRNGGSSVL